MEVAKMCTLRLRSVVVSCCLTFFTYWCAYKWKWKLYSDKGYSISGVYHLLVMEMSKDRSILYDIVWIKVIPLKIYLFVWGLLQTKLYTKDNLIRHGCIRVNSGFCTIGCGKEKNADNFFWGCDLFGTLDTFGLLSSNGCEFVQMI